MGARSHGTRSIEKGKAFERLVVTRLRAIGIECRRNLSQTRSARADGCDIEGTRWWIECCHSSAAAPRKKMIQALRDREARGDTRPILIVWRRTGMRSVLVSGSLAALMDLWGMGSSSDPEVMITVDLEEVLPWMRGQK